MNIKSLYINKIALFTIIAIGIALLIPTIVSAAAVPAVRGRVVNGITNAPIPGVWVKWDNGQSCKECSWGNPCSSGETCSCEGDGRSTRYALTDEDGYFYFESFKKVDADDFGRMIDTDLDGTNDAPIIEMMKQYCDGTFERETSPDFGCGTNPHTFNVVQPTNWDGTFTTLGPGEENTCNVCINNGAAVHDAGIIQYFPPQAPTPTPQICTVPTAQAGSISYWWNTNTSSTREGVTRCGVQFKTDPPGYYNSTLKLSLKMTNLSDEDKKIVLHGYSCRCFNGNGGVENTPFCKGFEPFAPDVKVSSTNELGNCAIYEDDTIYLDPGQSTWLSQGITQYKGYNAGSLEFGYIGVSINDQTTCPEGDLGTSQPLGQSHIRTKADIPACAAPLNPPAPVPTTEPGTTPIPTNTPVPLPTQILFPAELDGQAYIDINNNCSRDAGDIATTLPTLELERLVPNTCSPYQQSKTPALDGTYSFNDLDCFSSGSATYRLKITSPDPVYALNCGNLFNVNVISGQRIVRDVGLTIIRDPWIQAFRGGIHANGNIKSSIPPSAIDKNLIRSDVTNSPDVGSGLTINTDNGTISANNWKASAYSQENYLELSFIKLTESLLSVADNSNYNGQPPSAADADDDGVAVYFARTNNLTINGNWQDINFPVIVVSQETVGGVGGDITIRDNITNGRITLGQQGFVMMVAEKDIIIENGIGENVNSSTTANLEGIFIAGRNVNAGGTGDRTVDKRLNISGTVITGINGSGAYVSNRSHEDNHLYPSDYFIFNPKLLMNTPNAISEPIYNWSEIQY